MSLRKSKRCPVHHSFFCCRWEQLWRQREFASPAREGINQIRACRFSRGIPEPTSQETRVPSPDSTLASPAEETAALPEFPGIWQGQSLVNTRGLCSLRFEIKPNPQKQGEFSAYPTLSRAYTPLIPSLHKPATAMDVADFLRPVSSILTGTVTNGILQFHIDNTLGDRCPPASFTLTPFSKQLAVEWQDASCGRGQMLLTKAKPELCVKSGYFGFPNLSPPSRETPIHKTREVRDHPAQCSASAKLFTQKKFEVTSPLGAI